MNFIRRMSDLGWRAIDFAMVLAMLAMIVLVFANVVLRYGFQSGIQSSVEFSRLLFVWIAMLGSVACLRHFEHLSLGELAEALFPRARFWLRRLVNLTILGCAAMMAIGCYRQVLSNWTNVSPMSGIPLGAFYLAGLVAGVLMGAIALLRIIDPSRAVAEESEDRTI